MATVCVDECFQVVNGELQLRFAPSSGLACTPDGLSIDPAWCDGASLTPAGIDIHDETYAVGIEQVVEPLWPIGDPLIIGLQSPIADVTLTNPSTCKPMLATISLHMAIGVDTAVQAYYIWNSLFNFAINAPPPPLAVQSELTVTHAFTTPLLRDVVTQELPNLFGYFTVPPGGYIRAIAALNLANYYFPGVAFATHGPSQIKLGIQGVSTP